MIKGRFAYNGSRMIVTDRDDENDDHEFHCGECFEIEISGRWHQVRIEHCSSGWYLIGLPTHFVNSAQRYSGHQARFE
jgi:hypothetical protein